MEPGAEELLSARSWLPGEGYVSEQALGSAAAVSQLLLNKENFYGYRREQGLGLWGFFLCVCVSASELRAVRA